MVAESLVGFGARALPGIETAIDSIESSGSQSEFASTAWLLLPSYAKIAGRAALPQLQRMINASSLVFLEPSLADASALSLGLTSYVDSLLPHPTETSICRSPEPRYELNLLIWAWETDDRSAFEATLGPTAKAAFTSMLATRSWEQIRAESLTGSARVIGMGYGFMISGPWSEPPETLGPRPTGQVVVDFENPELDTMFKSGSGDDCGRFRVRFHQEGAPPAIKFLVNNADLGELLALIATCVAATN